MSEDYPDEQDPASPRLRVSASLPLRVTASPPPGVPASLSLSVFSTHVVWTFAIRILMVLNSVVAGVIVARWLGAEGLGQLAVINVAVGTLVQLASLGLPS